MNNYNNPYNQYQYGNPPRNPYYNQNNQPYIQTNSYNIHKRSRYQWSNNTQGGQNAYPNQWAASSGPQWGQNFNPPPPVQNQYPSVRNEYYHHEEMQFEPQINNYRDRGTARNQDFEVTQRKQLPKRLQSITKKQNFVPSLLQNEDTNEPTNKTNDEVVKTPSASFAEPNKQILSRRYNNRQIDLLEAFSKPVESTKAERMMQMMGWKGGALGSSGQGLTEPLMPNIFQKRSAGFGVPEPKQDRKLQKNNKPVVPKPTQERKLKNRANKLDKQINKQERKVENKSNEPASNADASQPTNCQIIEVNPQVTKLITKGFKSKYIKMRKLVIKQQEQQQRQKLIQRKPKKKKRSRNADEDFKIPILHQILDFVNDDSRTVLAFDKELTNFQRKTVHNLVASIKEDNDEGIGNYDSLYMIDLIHEITEAVGSGDLFTESFGRYPDRQLHLYKSMPDHIYLITKDDLRNPDYVDDCIVIDDDEVEEPTVKADDKPEDLIIDLRNYSEGENVKTDILNLETKQNINNENTPLEGAKDANKNASNKTETCDNSVKTDILNDVQSQESINECNKETSTTSARVKDGEIINKPNEKTENRTTDSNSIESENKTVMPSGVQSQQSIGSDNSEKPTESTNTDLSNDIKVNQNTSTETNVKVTEDTTQNKEKVKTPKEQIRETIVEYFKEFANNETYTEIRFTGEFSELETDEIDTFMTDVELCIGNVNNCKFIWKSEDNLQDIFQNESYRLEFKVTITSDILILKVPRKKKESEDELDDEVDDEISD